uniref:Uncharacterized protein n=1 Tax=Rhizophora mucronata TaxID=61149 RepID=A0A2P2N384_RHIMU
MAMVEGNEPDFIVAAGKPSIPGPTAVPMIKLTAPQKLFLVPSRVFSVLLLLLNSSSLLFTI